MRYPLTVSALILLGIAGVGSSPRASGLPVEDPVRSDFAPGELTALCQKAIGEAKGKLDAIAGLSAPSRGFESTVLAFEIATADLTDGTQPLSFMKYVSPNPTTNSEGAKCEQSTGDFMVKAFGRRDLYNVLKDQKPSNAGEARLLQKTLEQFEANGLKLPDAQLAQVTPLLSQLNELQAKFSENLNNDSTAVELTPQELEGVPSDYLQSLKKTADGQRYIVGTKVTDFNTVTENAKSDEGRRKLTVAYNNRAGEANTKLLEQAIVVREKIASLLGYKTWADYQLSHNRMAASSKQVLDFLNGLKGKLAARDRQDIQQLLEFKKSLDSKATEVMAWDIPYLSYQLRKKSYSLDDERIRQYFPSDGVVQGMFKVYSQLLGVDFEQVQGAHTWAPDVKLYRILNHKDHRLIGYFYTDFIPRQGKYEHFASFTVINGRMLPGGYDKPVSAIVGNFNPPAGGKPSLLNHDEVVTVFHEFGHIMHQTLTRAPYASLSGSNVAQDFVEAPSQMLENWPWQPEVLNLLSGHYLDPSKKLPPELLDKMIAARDFQQGYYYTRQLMLALLDMTYHTGGGPVDTVAVYNQLYRDMIGVAPVSGGHFAAGFTHLMGGYDAGYYGYLWSEVYAADMFTMFQRSGLLDPGEGAQYRSIILERGNMEDAGDLLSRFLGRPSNNEAFLKKLHIGN